MVNASVDPSDSEEDAPMKAAEKDEDGGMHIGDIYIPPPPLPACTFDATGPRLIISDIVIENFKSYGGKISLGPFQKNFTAIVGPNGSGKSNVIDSMLFVFGYRAQKIRSKTVGVLIHSSDKYPNLTSCTVSVHFEKIIDRSPTEFEVIDGSQFVVSRTACKDNSSFYAINDRRVQFKEVSRLLRSHGIDLDHNRFLILQGEVEQISLMKPKAQTEHDTGMLEFLEDIIGSGRLKEPTQQLALKVEELNEMRTEKLNRVKAVEKEKDDLESVKEEAMEYIRTKNKITLDYNILYQCRIYREKMQIEKQQAKKKDLEENMADLFNRVKETDANYKQKNSENDELNKKLNVALKEIEDAETQFAEYDKMDTRCRQDLKNATSRNKQLIELINKEKAKLEDLEKSPDRLTSEIAELKQKRVKFVEDKAKVEKAFDEVMANLHSETKTQREQKDKHEAELMKLQKGRNEAKSKMDIAKVELDLYLKNEQDEKAKLDALHATYMALLESLKESEIKNRDLSENLPELENSSTNSKRELETVSAQELETAEQLRVQRAKVEDAKSTVRNTQNRGRLLEALMQEKNSGRLPGIIGRLGDLGAINEKYDVAISTACPSLDNIVTDTLDTAQQCIQLMKRQNLGQATFIGLDKMQVWQNQSRQKINTPQNVPRLFDLIKVQDERVMPAFYFALRDTLVANEIGQATEIGLSGRTRYRVVTLKGELIDTSGTMSGGGSRPIRGRMGSSVMAVADAYTPQQIQTMDAEIEALHGKMIDLRKRKAELEELVRQHQRAVEECRHSLQKCRMDMQALTRDEPVLKANLREQQERTRAAVPDLIKVQQLTKHLNKCAEEFQKLDDASSAVIAKVQSLDDEINEISGGRVQTAQKKLDDVNKAIDTMDSTIMKDEVAIKTAHRNIAKTGEKIVDAEVEKETLATYIANCKTKLQEFEVKGSEVNEKFSTQKDEAKAIEKEVVAIREELKRINKLKAEYDSQKLDVNHQLADFDNKIKQFESNMKSSEKKLSALSLERTDEEGEMPKLPTVTEEELERIDTKAIEFKITDNEHRLKDMNPNLASIGEFKRKEELYLQRVNELDSITRNRDSQRQHHENLRKQRLNEFMEGFQIISLKLKETYQMLTLGGDAELELVNSLDPFSDGIVFSVRPPRKSWKNISNLSGGEKTLSSLALVFALHYYKPTPFYVMDEIDAALDFRNVTIVGHYIKEQTKNAQFIVISLRNHLFELADRLIGIYKTYNTSNSVAIDPNIGQSQN